MVNPLMISANATTWNDCYNCYMLATVASEQFPNTNMGVGRWGTLPGIFKISAKKGCFLSFEWEKQISPL